MKDLSRCWENLALTEKEGLKFSLPESEVAEGFAVAAKFFTKRKINLEAVARMLRSFWKAEQGFEIRDLGENKALFVFNDEIDMDRVLMLSPWTFDKYLVALHKLETDEQVKTVNFNKASFWVQIHNLPPRRMTKDVGVSIGRTLGEVEDVDMGEEGKALGRCIRVRVKLDLSQPLCCGRLVSFGSRESLWVNFKYERLPIFCYWCGKLNQDDKDCVLWINSKGSLRKED